MDALNKKEIAWFNRLEKVMLSCPSKRIRAYTTGDNDLTFYDGDVLAFWISSQGSYYESASRDDMCMQVNKSGAELIVIPTDFTIDSTAG